LVFVVDVSSFAHDLRSVCPSLLSKQNPHSVAEGPETERSSDNLLCFPAEHTVYPMTVKTASNRFALKKRFSQFVTLDAQVRPDSMRRVVFAALLTDKRRCERRSRARRQLESCRSCPPKRKLCATDA
jgi:hypothetical protein